MYREDGEPQMPGERDWITLLGGLCLVMFAILLLVAGAAAIIGHVMK